MQHSASFGLLAGREEGRGEEAHKVDPLPTNLWLDGHRWSRPAKITYIRVVFALVVFAMEYLLLY